MALELPTSLSSTVNKIALMLATMKHATSPVASPIRLMSIIPAGMRGMFKPSLHYGLLWDG
jgi:hypothetical protein